MFLFRVSDENQKNFGGYYYENCTSFHYAVVCTRGDYDSVIANVASFFGVLVVMTILPITGAFAETTEAANAALGLGEGLKYIGAALSTGLGSIGTGIAVGGAAPAAIGAVSENDKAFSKALIFVALGEGVAIYGLLISILILFG